jgi:hypothetical protein
MLERLKKAGRISLLLLYGAYALSPIYASAPISASGGSPLKGRQQPATMSMGIVWVNVLLSSLLDAEIEQASTAGGTTLAEQDGELILIKKKRAVLRERQVAAPPIVSAITLQDAPADHDLLAVHIHEIPLDPMHRASNGYRTLHTGLSPPTYLS